MHSRETLNDHKGNVSIGRDTAADPFFVVLRQTVKSEMIRNSSTHSLGFTSEKAYLIAPPTSCPRFRDTIHRARYFPRAPEGASVMMAPASATYQQAVPIPLIAPLRMRYCRKDFNQIFWTLENNFKLSIDARYVEETSLTHSFPNLLLQ
jgi:hypothetical protein